MAGASTSSGSAPSSGRLNLLLHGMPEALEWVPPGGFVWAVDAR